MFNKYELIKQLLNIDKDMHFFILQSAIREYYLNY